MLRLDKQEVDAQTNISYFRDGDNDHLFYPLPKGPRFRLDDRGVPVFKYIKYREAAGNTDPNAGGGFCFFDIEWVIPSDQLEALKKNLQAQVDSQHPPTGTPSPQVEFGQISFTKGSMSIDLEDISTNFVMKLWKSAKPSLFGNHVATVAVEFTRKGATIFEQAMQGQGASFVGVSYDMSFEAQLPPVTGYAEFNAEQFYSYFQTIDIDENMWGEYDYQETIREQMINAKAETVYVDPGWANLNDPKIVDQVRGALYQALEEAVQSKMLDALNPVSDDFRKRPDHFDHVKRDVLNTRIASFRMNITEGEVIEFANSFPGNLPVLTGLMGPDGKPLNWKDFSQDVDVGNDPFFNELDVSVTVNADFDKLPIFSVIAHLDYTQGNTHASNDFMFRSANDVGKFSTYIENAIWKYKYSYVVSYKDQSKTYTSPTLETDTKQLQINVDDLGILAVDIVASGINFDQVQQAQVTMQYQDAARGISPIEEQFILDKNTKEQQFLAFLFQPAANQYRYQVQYFMADGKQYQGSWINGQPNPGQASKAYIHSPFSANKHVSFRGVGDFDTSIDTIFLDLVYSDDTNHYTQTQSVALNKSTQFYDWSFPVISETLGKVTYSGQIKRKDNSVTPIAQQEATKNTILVGDEIPGILAVQVYPDAVDFTQVKFVEVALHYTDMKNNVDIRNDIVLRKTTTNPLPWNVPVKDTLVTTFQWQATFFMNDNSKRQTAWITTDASITGTTTIFPDLADAKPLTPA